MKYEPTKFMAETSHYDKAAADYAVAFIQQLKHTKGIWAGKPFKLLGWQEQIIRDVFGMIKENGYRQFTTAYVEIPKKNGKELHLSTPIPTPEGWSTMGDIAVGDLVLDECGKPCHVIAKSKVDTDEDAYRIVFRDGSSVIAGANHQWMVDYVYGKTKSGVIMTSEEIARKQDKIADHYGDTVDGNRSCIRIRVTDELDLPDAKLPLDPYTYGLWLGDGWANERRICVCNDDLPYILSAIPYEPLGIRPNGDGGSSCIRYAELSEVLVANWRDKVIRKEYLRASAKQRWGLLAGLIDSDGHVSKSKGQASISGVVKPLMESARELLWSLGIKNSMTEGPSLYHNQPTGETLYTIRFTAFDDMPLSKLPRYLERRIPRSENTRSGYHYIKSIENLGNGIPMQCIQVDSPSHCYLCGSSMVPTHNSELAAAVALFLLCADGEQRAEVYGAAADRQQATIVYDVAADMVRMSPALMKRSKILAANKRLNFLPTNSFYQVLSADSATKHGFNVSGVVFDELHVQPNRKLYDVLTQGSGDARTQPLYFLITTAGTDRNSICWELHQKAKDILEGRKIDPTFYPVIYGADEDDDWTDPEVWAKANPSLGETITIDKVRAACESAKQNPGEENAFRQLRLNQWVNQSVRWMPMDKWDACNFPVDADELAGRPCYGGLDLSTTTDITAFVLVFPPRNEEEKYAVLPFFWIPEDNIQRRVNRDHVPYDVWKRQKILETTEGNVLHYSFIEAYIEKLGEKYDIREIAYDRWGATQLSQDLEGMGFTMVPFGQGYASMSPPTKELMNMVLEERLAHGGNVILRWMMDNVYIRQDAAGNIKADKEKSTEKIDGVVAMIMALDRATRGGGGPTKSIYDTRGMLFI